MFIRSPPLLLFPIYLLPSLPFRRHKRRNPTTSSPSTTPTPSPPYLTTHTSYLRCAKCATHICPTSQIISKGFTGRHGRAYLVSPSPPATSLPNTKTDAPSSRQLVTGVHLVADVRCGGCGSMVGWRYEGAEEEGQRYKVGKYILETKMVVGWSEWEVGGDEGRRDGEGEVEFDSEDEEECEDLFAGVWSRELAGRRRERRAFRVARGEGGGGGVK